MEYMFAAGGGGFLGLMERMDINEWAIIAGAVLLGFVFFATTRRK